MPKYHQMQLPDGRFVRMRELTSDLQSAAYEAASERSPTGALLPPNPVKLDVELYKMALCGLTEKKPLYKLDAKKQPIPKVDGKGKALTRLDGKPVYERFDPAELAESDWKPLTYGQLETEYDTLFGPKERTLIGRLYAAAHVLTNDDADFFETIHSVSVTG